MTSPVVTILPYADLPSRWGVTSERRQSGLRVVVPPVPNWRHLPKAYAFIFIPVFVVCDGTLNSFLDPRKLPELLPTIVFYTVLMLGIIAHAIWRLGARTILDVSREELSVAVVRPGGRGPRAVWSRRAVGEVKLNSISGKLLIRITGKDMVEYFVSSNPEVTRWVAETVNRALIAGDFSPMTEDDFTAIPQPRRTGWLKAIGVGIMALFLGQVIFGIVSDGAHVGLVTSGVIEFAFATMVLAGLSLGTRGREYYF